MKVKFVPQNVEYEIAPGQSVMRLAHEKGLHIKSVCNGMPSCAECRVRVVKGEHNLMPPSLKEINLIGTGHFIDHRRLSCQMQCFGHVVVDLSEQIEKEKASKNRQPQGNLKTEVIKESLAITGNLIDQDKSLLKEADDSYVENEDSDNVSLLNEAPSLNLHLKRQKNKKKRRNRKHKHRKSKK